MDMETARKLLEKIRPRFKGRKFPDSLELIREDRDRRRSASLMPVLLQRLTKRRHALS